MSCVLRVTSEFVPEVLRGGALRPYRVEQSTAHFQVSVCDFNNLPGQAEDAVTFLRSHKAEISALLAAPAARGVLDFAVESVSSEFRFAVLPPELVREAGFIGLALELSLYPAEIENEV